MEGRLTIRVLKKRWEKALEATHVAAVRHPQAYRQVKDQASEIIDNPVDIKEYFPTVERLLCCLESLDPERRGSIFDIFNARIYPSSIWHVKMLRMECKDLLFHLDAFDAWRRKKHRLRVVK